MIIIILTAFKMALVKFLLNIGCLGRHKPAEDLLHLDPVGKFVVVGKVVSVTNTELNSGLLKSVCMEEVPPIHVQNNTKNTINLFLRHEFVSLEFTVGGLVAFNPETVTKSKDGTLQASVGFDDNDKGQIWIDGSSGFAVERNTSGQQNVPALGICKGECYCAMVKWCATPFLAEESRSMALKEASYASTPSFNLTCKVLKTIQLGEECAVFRVTDGTLYKWPLLYFDGHGFGAKTSMNRDRHFIDILVVGIGDRFQAVKVNMLLKLYGVEIGKFDSSSVVYHGFRSSGHPDKFKILPDTHSMGGKINNSLNALVEHERPMGSRHRKLLNTGVTFCFSNSYPDPGKDSRLKAGAGVQEMRRVANEVAGPSGITAIRGSQDVRCRTDRLPNKFPVYRCQESKDYCPATGGYSTAVVVGRDCVDAPDASDDSSVESFLIDPQPYPSPSRNCENTQTQQSQSVLRPLDAPSPEMRDGGRVANERCGCPVLDCEHRPEKSKSPEEVTNHDEESSIDLHISESSVEGDPMGGQLNPSCGQNSCEMLNVNTLEISQLPFRRW